jgi:hypothetical protein
MFDLKLKIEVASSPGLDFDRLFEGDRCADCFLFNRCQVRERKISVADNLQSDRETP